MNRAVTRAAPCALFLHGAGAWGGQWAIWRRVFEAEGWRTSAPDREPAAKGLAATRFNDHLAQSIEAFEALGGDDARPPVLIGASLGGLLAFAVAAQRRSAHASIAPAALVLVNPLPPAPWAARLPALRSEGDADVVPWHSQGRFASTLRALPDASFSDRLQAFRHWRDESAALLQEAHAGLVLEATSAPVLVIAGEADTDVPPGVSAAFAQGIDASFLSVPGGHIDPVMGGSAATAARLALTWLRALRRSELSTA